jgi:addiction module RelB/DinJ family antitoxin
MNNIKTETLHVRLSPSIKNEAEEILQEMGLNMSYAVAMFLKQVIIKRKIPFDIELKSDEAIKKEEELAFAINATGGKEISPKLKHIIHLYANGDIDYETACFAINRCF